MAGEIHWPESYGFSIVGDGPSYVIAVQRHGVANSAGISPGDQLLELDGINVSEMSADHIKILAKNSRTIPPTVGVRSRVQHLELVADRRWGYGFTIKGVFPTYIDSVDPPGPAYQAGMRPGWYILKVWSILVSKYTMYP